MCHYSVSTQRQSFVPFLSSVFVSYSLPFVPLRKINLLCTENLILGVLSPHWSFTTDMVNFLTMLFLTICVRLRCFFLFALSHLSMPFALVFLVTLFCLFIWGMFSFGCPGTCSVDQAGLELRILLAFASGVLGSNAFITMPDAWLLQLHKNSLSL